MGGEAILISTHNIGFYDDLIKIIFELSSNTHLISSAALFYLMTSKDIMLIFYPITVVNV